MALVFNNVTVPQSGNVIYNGMSLSVVKHGNTQVWKRAPEYLYNNGDQCSGFTGLGCPRRLFSEYRYLLPQPDGHEACFQHRKYFSDVYRKLSGRRQRHHKLACRSVGGFITDGEYQ